MLASRPAVAQDRVVPDEVDEDVLELGRRSRVPRWAYLAGGLLAAVFVAGAVLALRGGPAHPGASARTLPHDGLSGGNRGTPTGPDGADDVVLVGRYLFRLSPDALYRTDTIGAGDSARVLPISGLDALAPADSYHLAADPLHHLIWVVGYGGLPSSVLAVDLRTMAVRDRAQWPARVGAAAALGGHLYLVTDNAIADVAAGSPPTALAGLDGRYLAIAADPARERLLLVDAASRRSVAFTPSSGAVLAGPKLGFAKGYVVVNGAGQVWAGGYGDRAGGGAVLVRLDPHTLAPITSSPLARQLGPGAQLVAAGAHVIWVRSGAGGDGLWCVDGATGRVAQHWNVSGTVASGSGAAYLDRLGELRPLALARCRG